VSSAPRAGGLEEDVLVQRARTGDMEAFEELVMRHADRLFATLRSFGLDELEAHEVAQETFLRAWRALPGFEGRARFFTWLYRIAFNEAQRLLARRPPAGLLVSSELASVDDLPDREPGPAARLETEELRVTLRRALSEIPIELRAAVVLRDVEGLSTRDAASVLELGEAAFKSRLHRGRLALRSLLAPLIVSQEH
jgi:RNA polymerase sigma-70 factor (ECF subfamily)